MKCAGGECMYCVRGDRQGLQVLDLAAGRGNMYGGVECKDCLVVCFW